jgi:Protein of unknown function (DUF3800)/SEC-C motif
MGLEVSENTLLIFIDETGCEDLKDPNNPSFGRAGCAILGRHYNKIISDPWKKMKNEFFQGEHIPWHTNEIKFSKLQIDVINKFVDRSFIRFGQIFTNKTDFDERFTAHKVISESFVSHVIPKLREKFKRFSDMVLIFESSKRLNDVVQAEFNPDKIRAQIDKIYNSSFPIRYFLMDKKSCAPGLEIADLVAHTLGRQNRHFVIQEKQGFLSDFQKVFQNKHCLNVPIFIKSIDVNKPHKRISDKKTARNQHCPCGSGKKYKKCCL